MPSPEFEALFAQTLLGDYESDQAWSAVAELRSDGSREIFDYAAAWCRSDSPLKRARAAAILCQLRRKQATDPPAAESEWLFRNESYSLITQMLDSEQDPIVLDSAICALGHLYFPQAIPIILRYQDHPNKDVRFAVAFSLGSFPHEPRSVDGLLRLTSNADADVRDWAVFGLAVQGDVDSVEIREALLRCLDDPDADVREEAAVGLGKRRDERLIPGLRTMLDGPEINHRVAEAASALLGLDEDPPQWGPEDYKEH